MIRFGDSNCHPTHPRLELPHRKPYNARQFTLIKKMLGGVLFTIRCEEEIS